MEIFQVRIAAQVRVAKQYHGYWKNSSHKNIHDKVLALAMGIPVAEPLLATNMFVATIFF